MAKKVGELIKEARTAAGLSQARLAELVEGLTAADVGKAERGEKDLTQAVLKEIAKATGVTQKSLLEAPKGGSSASTSSKNDSASKASQSKNGSKSGSSSKTASKSGSTGTSKAASKSGSAAKSTSKSTSKTSASSKTSSKTASNKSSGTSSAETEKLTNAEKQLLKLYRAADSDTKKAAVSLLKGEKSELQNLIGSLLQNSSAAQAIMSGSSGGNSTASDEDGGLLGALLGSAMDLFGMK